jgi:hypothetical protein
MGSLFSFHSMENQERSNITAKKQASKANKETPPVAHKRKLEEGERRDNKITEERDLTKRLKIRLMRCDQNFTPH